MDENERLIKKIMDERNCSYDMASNVFSNLKNVHPALKDVVASWKKGIEIPFEYNGITMADIKKKERSTYLDAIFSMCVLLEDPELVVQYMSMDFSIDDLWR